MKCSCRNQLAGATEYEIERDYKDNNSRWSAEWQRRNKARAQATQDKFTAKNPGYALETTRRSKANNPERYRASCWRDNIVARLRRAEVNEAWIKQMRPGITEAEYILALFDGEGCVGCGITIEASGKRLAMDHILPLLEYPDLAFTPSNLQVLCRSCNSSKTKRSS